MARANIDVRALLAPRSDGVARCLRQKPLFSLEGEWTTADKTMDCKNLRCPMPVVMPYRESKEMSAGDTIEVIANDPALQVDVRAWCKRTVKD